MENTKDRQEAYPYGITMSYFRAPYSARGTAEVRYAGPVTKPVTKSETKKHALPRERALTKVAAITVATFLILIPAAKYSECLRDSNYYRPLPPELAPAHPSLGMVIRANGHTWIYWGDYENGGWIDP